MQVKSSDLNEKFSCHNCKKEDTRRKFYESHIKKCNVTSIQSIDENASVDDLTKLFGFTDEYFLETNDNATDDQLFDMTTNDTSALDYSW